MNERQKDHFNKMCRDFSIRLKACRIAAGYRTSEEFVRKFPAIYGLKTPAYNKYERGEGFPGAWSLPELARRLNTTVDFLLIGAPRDDSKLPSD